MFTPESANAILEEVRRRIENLMRAYELVATHQEEVSGLSQGNGGGPDTQDFLGASSTIAAEIRWFSEQEIIVRDIEQGLIDFPSERDGREIYLCWRAGEETVAHWHPTDTGFSGRRPL